MKKDSIGKIERNNRLCEGDIYILSVLLMFIYSVGYN